MSLKSGTVIEKSRPMADNEFIFYKRVIIDSHEIWELFDYINRVSNIQITLECKLILLTSNACSISSTLLK